MAENSNHDSNPSLQDYREQSEYKDPLQVKSTDVIVVKCPLHNEETTKESEHNNKSSPERRLRSESKLSRSDEENIIESNKMDSLVLYKVPFCKKMWSLRWKMCFMCFIISSLSMTVRQCMSMAIVCMNRQKIHIQENASLPNVTQDIEDTGMKEFFVQWDSQTEGLVLSSYFYTVPLSPVLSGYLAGKYGAKYVTLVMMLLMCTASIAIPLVAFLSPAVVIVLRALVGFGAGGLPPCLNQLISKWAPKTRKVSGLSIGSIITFAFSGLICKIEALGGWPFIFYIFSAANLSVVVIWVLVVHDSPEVHPKSNDPEIQFILQERSDNAEKMPSPPWKKLLTSGPVWAILIPYACFAAIFTIMSTFLPLYMKDVLKYDPASNGLLSSLPFIGRFFAAMVVGRIADKCLERKMMSTVLVRKMFQCTSTIASAPFLIGLSFLTEKERALAVIFLVAYWIFQSCKLSAFYVSHLDIAPMYAGVINGIAFTCASLVGLASPSMVTAINKNNTREEWQIIFFICVGIDTLGAITFCILGSGEVQNWAKTQDLTIELEAGQGSKPLC